MTAIISYLNQSIALSLLDIQELFGRGYELNFNPKDGFLVSDELTGLTVNGKSYSLPVLKTDLLQSKIFLDESDFLTLADSIYNTNKTFFVELNGPNGSLQREVSIFKIGTSFWVKKGTKTTNFIEFNIETMNSSHSFRGITVVESFLDESQLVLNPIWKNIIGTNVKVEINEFELKSSNDVFSGKSLITESDIRLAILKKQRIDLKKVIKITPSAMELGNSAKIFY